MIGDRPSHNARPLAESRLVPSCPVSLTGFLREGQRCCGNPLQESEVASVPRLLVASYRICHHAVALALGSTNRNRKDSLGLVPKMAKYVSRGDSSQAAVEKRFEMNSNPKPHRTCCATNPCGSEATLKPHSSFVDPGFNPPQTLTALRLDSHEP